MSGSPAGPGGNGNRFLWRILYIYNIQAVKQARHVRRISGLNMTLGRRTCLGALLPFIKLDTAYGNTVIYGYWSRFKITICVRRGDRTEHRGELQKLVSMPAFMMNVSHNVIFLSSRCSSKVIRLA